MLCSSVDIYLLYLKTSIVIATQVFFGTADGASATIGSGGVHCFFCSSPPSLEPQSMHPKNSQTSGLRL